MAPRSRVIIRPRILSPTTVPSCNTGDKARRRQRERERKKREKIKKKEERKREGEKRSN